MLQSGQTESVLQQLVRAVAATAPGPISPASLASSSAPLLNLLPASVRCYSKAAKTKKKAQAGDSKVAAQPQEGGGQAWDRESMIKHMEKTVEHLQHEFASLRSGRATPGMFDHLKADVYGDKMPLKNLGTSSVRDAHLLTISVFDPSTVAAVEKALRDGPMQLNPRSEGQEVLVPVPKPTPESVAAMSKIARSEAEGAKVAVRQERKRAMDALKALESEDERKRAEKEVQKMTDKYIEEVDRILKIKEKDFQTML